MILCFLSGSVAVLPAASQQRAKPFETLEFSGGAAMDVSRAFFHNYWKPGRGAELQAMTPFYWGQVEAGAAYHRYAADLSDVPRFDAFYAFVGWGLQASLLPGLNWEGSARIGNYRMSFDEQTFGGVQNESEVTASLHTRLVLRFYGPWSVYASGAYMKTFTFVNLKPAYLSTGIAYTVRTPRWLSEVLQ